MIATVRLLGLLLSCLATLGLAGCGGGGPAATIGDLSIDRYVALGDGYASAPYSGKTDAARGCLRSETSYPAQLAELLEVTDFVDVTCAFARTQDLTRAAEPARGKSGTVPAQLDEVTEKTDLVTLTVGLSDREFARRLFEICADPCEDEDRVPIAELGADLQRIGTAVGQVLEDVLERAPEARVIVVGYPTLLPAEGRCKTMPELSQREADLVNAVLGQLNRVLQTTARQNDAEFLDVTDVSQGHDMCADEPWVKGTDGEPRQVPRFHPLAPLNEAIAARLAADLQP